MKSALQRFDEYSTTQAHLKSFKSFMSVVRLSRGETAFPLFTPPKNIGCAFLCYCRPCRRGRKRSPLTHAVIFHNETLNVISPSHAQGETSALHPPRHRSRAHLRALSATFSGLLVTTVISVASLFRKPLTSGLAFARRTCLLVESTSPRVAPLSSWVSSVFPGDSRRPPTTTTTTTPATTTT